MDRRQFLNKSTGAIVAAGLGSTVFPAIALGSEETSKRAPAVMDYKPDGGVPGALKVRFLGTGAADWNGRDERGELRRLSSALWDNLVLTDFTPTDEDMVPPGVRPEVIFYTHSHGDHYNPGAALKLGVKRVYLGSTWVERARADFEKAASGTGLEIPEIIPVSPGDKATVFGLTFTTLPSNHATGDLKEQTLMYLVEKQDIRVLYATDTGGIPAIAGRLAGIDPHVKGTPLTGIIMEATMGIDGDEDFRIFTHSSVRTVERTVHMLLREKRYTPADGQPVYLTHMARTLHPRQAELDATLPAPLKAAYDGLEVVFR